MDRVYSDVKDKEHIFNPNDISKEELIRVLL